ncbi:MAG: hypothetical protein ACM3PT_02610 [Deltaproteobacteria bacterium]
MALLSTNYNPSVEELEDMKKKYPFSYIPDLLINRKLFVGDNDISLGKLTELAGKTNNSGLSLASVIGNTLSDQKENTIISSKETEPDNETDEENKLNEAVASERLAKIYLQQGLKKEAIEIYKKISLHNKKKNNTFAQF